MHINTLTFDIGPDYYDYSEPMEFTAYKAKIDGRLLYEIIIDFKFDNDLLGTFGPEQHLKLTGKCYNFPIRVLKYLHRMLNQDREKEENEDHDEYYGKEFLPMVCVCSYEGCSDFTFNYEREGDIFILDARETFDYNENAKDKFPIYRVTRANIEQEYNRLLIAWQAENPTETFDPHESEWKLIWQRNP